MMLPIFLIVLSNCFYNICSKSTPHGVHPFATLMITYITAAIVTGIILILMVRPENVATEITKISWTSIALSIAIIGLETGYILAYRAGWQINTAPLVANTLLTFALIFVGALLFKETITLKQILGIIICLFGMILINI